MIGFSFGDFSKRPLCCIHHISLLNYPTQYTCHNNTTVYMRLGRHWNYNIFLHFHSIEPNSSAHNIYIPIATSADAHLKSFSSMMNILPTVTRQQPAAPPHNHTQNILLKCGTNTSNNINKYFAPKKRYRITDI